VLSLKVIKELVVQTDRQSLDHQERDTELTSITLSAAGSQSLAYFPLVHEACILTAFSLCYDMISFFSLCDRFGIMILSEGIQVLALVVRHISLLKYGLGAGFTVYVSFCWTGARSGYALFGAVGFAVPRDTSITGLLR